MSQHVLGRAGYPSALLASSLQTFLRVALGGKGGPWRAPGPGHLAGEEVAWGFIRGVHSLIMQLRKHCPPGGIHSFLNVAGLCSQESHMVGAVSGMQKLSCAIWNHSVFSSRGSYFTNGCHPLLLFRATPTAYGSSRARSPIGAAAAGLYQSHSSAGSEPCLRPTPQLTATQDP